MLETCEMLKIHEIVYVQLSNFEKPAFILKSHQYMDMVLILDGY